MERKTGFLDIDLYRIDDSFSINIQMGKADRLATGEGSTTYDMALAGVDEDSGETRGRKVEDSWGDKYGHEGSYEISQKWPEGYVYDVVVDKKYLLEDLAKLQEEPTVDLKPWEHISL